MITLSYPCGNQEAVAMRKYNTKTAEKLDIEFKISEARETSAFRPGLI